MKPSRHLSSIEWSRITILHCEGLRVRKIAKELGRNPSIISRELNRHQAAYYRGKYIGSQTDKNEKRNWLLKYIYPFTWEQLKLYLLKKRISKYLKSFYIKWLRELDLNQRPSGYEASLLLPNPKRLFTIYHNLALIFMKIYFVSLDWL